MFSKGIFSPWDFKNSCIGPAASGGLAVNTNWSFVPNFLALAIAFSKKGPLAPSVTTLNSEKSNLPPLFNILCPSVANCSASNLIFS